MCLPGRAMLMSRAFNPVLMACYIHLTTCLLN